MTLLLVWCYGTCYHPVIKKNIRQYSFCWNVPRCTKCLCCFHVVHIVGLFGGFFFVRTSFDGIRSTITKKSLMKLCKTRSSFSSIFGKRKSPIPGVGLDPFQMAELHGYRWGFLTIRTTSYHTFWRQIDSTKMGKFMKFLYISCNLQQLPRGVVPRRKTHGLLVKHPSNWIKLLWSANFLLGQNWDKLTAGQINPRDPRIRC